MNVKPNNSETSNTFKKPLTPLTADDIFEYCAKANTFFKTIEIDEKIKRKNKITRKWETHIVRKSVMKSQNFTPFFGIAHNLTAIKLLYEDLVINGPLEALYTFQFSQDHLETWFSCVRRGLGNNALCFRLFSEKNYLKKTKRMYSLIVYR